MRNEVGKSFDFLAKTSCETLISVKFSLVKLNLQAIAVTKRNLVHLIYNKPVMSLSVHWLSSHICVNRQGENPRIFQTVLLFTLRIPSESPCRVELFGWCLKGYQTSIAAVRDHYPILEILLSHPPLFLLYLYTTFQKFAVLGLRMAKICLRRVLFIWIKI